jgi:hypothetical protein
MTEDAKKELEEAVDAVEELIEANEMPFSRWLIKLLVEKMIVPAVVPALTAFGTSVVGWYAIGQNQLTDKALQAGLEAGAAQVEKLDRARELVDEATPEPVRGAGGITPPPEPSRAELELELERKLLELREKWEARTREMALESPSHEPDVSQTQQAANSLDQRILEQKTVFPEDYVRQQLEQKMGLPAKR